MRWLARRDYSRHEMEARLARQGAHPDVVQSTVDELVDEDLLSDDRFAAQFARSRIGKRQGPLKIRAELSARGVADGIIDRQLAELDVEWTELARGWLETHGGVPSRHDLAARSRAYRRLANRGFTHAQAMRCMDS